MGMSLLSFTSGILAERHHSHGGLGSSVVVPPCAGSDSFVASIQSNSIEFLCYSFQSWVTE